MCLYGRRENGERFEKSVINTQPYFYAEEVPYVIGKEIVLIQQNAIKSVNEAKLAKVFVRFPYDVPTVRNQFDITYEANILYEDRMRYDMKIKSGIEIPNDWKWPLVPEVIKSWDANTVVPRIAFYDIETDDVGGFADGKNPTSEVVSFVYYDNYINSFIACINCRGNVNRMKEQVSVDNIKKWYALKCNEERPIKVIFAKDENALFATFTKLLKEYAPDYISGYNSAKFDTPYMANRARNLKYPFPSFNYSKGEFEKIEEFDFYKAYRKLKNKRLKSYKLEYVSQLELGFGKIQRRKIHWMYENDPEKLVKYNIQDVRLLDLLNKKKRIFRYFMSIAKLAGCRLSSTMYNSMVVDSYIMHELNGKYALPTEAKTYSEEHDEEWRKGAHVVDVEQGRYKLVISCDNSGEYPNCMRTFNIDPSRRVPSKLIEENPDEFDGKVFSTPRGNYYLKEPIGVLPKILADLIEKEKYLKQRKEELIKENKYNTDEYAILDETYGASKALRNSVYGVIGARSKDRFRLRDENAFSDVTSIARMHEHWNIDFIKKKYNAVVVSGDTDSVKFYIPGLNNLEDVIEISKRIEKELNASYNEMLKSFGVEKHYLFAKIEYIDESFAQWAKKMYAHVKAYQDGKILLDLPIADRMEIVGAKSVRSDSSDYAGETMEKVLRMILEFVPIAEIKSFIRKEIEKFKLRKIPVETLHRPIGLKMRLDEYINVPVQIRAMEFSNKYLGKNFQGGDKLMYMFGEAIVRLEGNRIVKSDVWAIERGDKLTTLSKQFNVTFKPDWERAIDDHLKKPLIGDGKNTRGPLLCLGMDWDEIVSGKKQKKLESCF